MVSGISEKQKMRDALRITERNLSSMIGAGFTPTSIQAPVFIETMEAWRDMCRRALGYEVQERECICPKCGIRHGITHTNGDF